MKLFSEKTKESVTPLLFRLIGPTTVSYYTLAVSPNRVLLKFLTDMGGFTVKCGHCGAIHG